MANPKPAPTVLGLYALGQKGVNVDKSDLHMDDQEVRQAQNAIRDPLGAEGGLRSRPGLSEFSAEADGAVLGGVGVPLTNQRTGSSFLYIGRGPVS